MLWMGWAEPLPLAGLDPAFAHCLRPGHSNGVPSAEPPRAKFHVFTFIHPQGTKSPLVEFRHWAEGVWRGASYVKQALFCESGGVASQICQGNHKPSARCRPD